MKKVITICLILVTSLQVQAQWWGKGEKGNGNITTITRSVGSYDEVNVGGSFDVELVAGKEGTITIEGDSNLMEYIVTEVRGNALKIKVENNKNIRATKKIKITVPFQDLDEVSLAGSGNMWNKDVIKTTNFRTSVAGSGDLTLKVDADSVDASVAGSGDLTLTGNSRDLDVSVAGSGEVHAKDLKADNAVVSVAGSGDISVYCSKSIRARVSGSGDIDYYGNPDKQDTKVSGSGKIKMQ
ncbi:head GIN domain-containing protein [uncultured Dokdonia sp.]|uniref:head GIN domain-containing protein n=1 Tax=uncultured Dokdonia sp. TaxID=575653 RepID=UPI00261BB548|nr:head GIN domain-containing protein [uncultured Dokdonia sp.]